MQTFSHSIPHDEDKKKPRLATGASLQLSLTARAKGGTWVIGDRHPAPLMRRFDGDLRA